MVMFLVQVGEFFLYFGVIVKRKLVERDLYHGILKPKAMEFLFSFAFLSQHKTHH